MGFGERLQREREMRGITLEEISASTKIGIRSLRALEKEDFDQLPGGVFNKGFVRAYAKYLGINEEQAVADYMSAAGEQEMPMPQPMPKFDTQVVVLRQKNHSKYYVLAAALVLIAGGTAAYKYRPDLIGMAPAAAEEPIAESRDVAAEAENEELPASSTATLTEASAATSTGPSANPASSPGTTPPPPETSAASVSFTLRLIAKQDSWVSITVDGKPAMTGTLSGERIFQAQREVKMTVGNAGAVEVSHNGHVLPPLGAENQARTVTITAQGIQR
jgi:cytoskeletal protein RodZ